MTLLRIQGTSFIIPTKGTIEITLQEYDIFTITEVKKNKQRIIGAISDLPIKCETLGVK